MAGFFYHSDIPNFVDTIGVTGDNHVTTVVEFNGVHGVVMAVEGLHAQVCSNIPKRHSFVSGS